MASLDLFSSNRTPKADTINSAGGAAFGMSAEHALAQYACAGFLGSTFYASAEAQLDKVQALALEVSPMFLAKTTIYSRSRGHAKDMPALLCVILLHRDAKLFELVAPQVLDNGRMIRNFVQMLRSGRFFGRVNIPKPAKRFIQRWLLKREGYKLFRDSVGNNPSIADVIRMVHPKPRTREQRAIFGYLTGGNDVVEEFLPRDVQKYNLWKRHGGSVPNVEFRLLTSAELTTEQWSDIADNAPWQALRMNLNTFARHGVWSDGELVRRCADRLRDENAIRLSRVMPYQILTAYGNLREDVPRELSNALQDAMEISTRNVPEIRGTIAICPDTSGSMNTPLTGERRGATTKVTCSDVAALIAAVVVRNNPECHVLPFDTKVRERKFNPYDSIVTIAQALAFSGGGTAVSAPVARLLRDRTKVDAIWIVSDNESWADRNNYYGDSTALSVAIKEYRAHVGPTKLICQDIVANNTTQAAQGRGALNIGGFSDSVFEVVDNHVSGRFESWVDTIKKVSLEAHRH